MPRPRPPSASTSWEDVADWYRRLAGSHGPELAARVLYPEVVRLLGRVRGRRVLDVGCGPGALARLLARRGARVVGVDASPAMVEAARRDARDAGVGDAVRFEVADAADVRSLPRGPFDAVSIVLALQNMEDPRRVLGNAARRLRSSGRLVVALNHPCFRIPGSTHWGWDEREQVQYRRVDRYLSRHKVDIRIHPGRDPLKTRPSYHWPLETLFAALRDAGLRAVDLVEPVSDRVSEGGRAQAENRARAEIPLFLVIAAERARGRPKPRRRSG